VLLSAPGVIVQRLRQSTDGVPDVAVDDAGVRHRQHLGRRGRAPSGAAIRWGTILPTQIVHWLGVVGAVLLIYVLQIYGRMTSEAAGQRRAGGPRARPRSSPA
jgi:hypothetical protein